MFPPEMFLRSTKGKMRDKEEEWEPQHQRGPSGDGLEAEPGKGRLQSSRGR